MRTTLTIDDDVLAAARALAAREQRSVGDVLSALARRALLKDDGEHSSGPTRNGVPLLPVKDANTTVTLELVNRLREELP